MELVVDRPTEIIVEFNKNFFDFELGMLANWTLSDMKMGDKSFTGHIKNWINKGLSK